MAEALQPLTVRFDARGVLRLFPPLTLFLFLAPVGAGLVGTLFAAFGYFPALGGEAASLAPWRDLSAAPGVASALRVSLIAAFGATALSLTVALVIVAGLYGTRTLSRLQRWLAPLLALPHASFAIGFGFLLAPSGWIARLISPWLTGWQQPPDIALVQDPAGLALMAALAFKEVFFLLLMILAALGQVRAGPYLATARCMGYGPVCAWIKVVLPLVYRQMRLPIYAVLAYGLSVVDMALVLGPTNPPTLAVLILRWSQDPDLAVRFQAAAGAALMLVLTLAAIAVWRLGELILARASATWLTHGGRSAGDRGFQMVARALLAIIAGAAVAAMTVIALWAITDEWRFPAALPQSVALGAWQAASGLWDATGSTIFIGFVAAMMAMVAVLGCLENENWNAATPTQRSLVLVYLPLVIPQISFLFGLQIALVAADLDGSWLAVTWSHLVFVLPYVFLVLSDPYRALDPRYAKTASTLGASPVRVFWRVRLPLLSRVAAAAAAVGFAVSVGQYLATLLPGAGRIATLTTEAIALSSGGDRRLTAVYALMQMLTPLLAFGLALSYRRSAR